MKVADERVWLAQRDLGWKGKVEPGAVATSAAVQSVEG